MAQTCDLSNAFRIQDLPRPFNTLSIDLLPWIILCLRRCKSFVKDESNPCVAASNAPMGDVRPYPPPAPWGSVNVSE